jgi:hypothetical protein
MNTGGIIDTVVERETHNLAWSKTLAIWPIPKLTLLTEFLWFISITGLVSKHHIMKVHRGDRCRTSCYVKYQFKINLW